MTGGRMIDKHSAWKRFWNRGGWWRALLLTVTYWGVYELIGLGTSTVFAEFIDASDPLGTPQSIFYAVALPIVIASLLLIALAWSLGWLRDLFARQPISGRPWMWLAVVLVIAPVVIRLFATGWSAWALSSVLALLFTGLCIGFAEELLTRGFLVTLLRKGGSGERAVLLLSSALFASLHAGNAITGQPIATVAATVAYAFGFGAMMYLALRVTGRLAWVILLHAATDPTTILATGGIDGVGASAGAAAGSDPLNQVAGLFSLVYVLFAIVAVFLVKRAEK